MNAIELLEYDHEEVSALLAEFAKASPEDKSAIGREICEALAVHAQIEEEILYPAAREALGESGGELIDEAVVEHDTLRFLIDEVEESADGEELFEARVRVLGEYLRHHIREEHEELFPKLRESALDLDALGEELVVRREQLASKPITRARYGRRVDTEEGDSLAAFNEDDLFEEPPPAAPLRPPRVQG